MAEETPDVEAQEENKPLEAIDDGGEAERDRLRMETYVVLIICATMAALFVVDMGIWSGTVIFVAGVVAIAVGSLVAKFQYFDLESLDTLRTVHNRLRTDVNTFSEENTKLTANNDRLEAEIAPLKDCEAKLAEIAEKSGKDVNKLKSLVSENQETIDKMHAIQKDDVVQSMMQLLMEADRDEDGELSDRESKRLVNKIRNLPTVKVNEDEFTKHLDDVRRVSYYIDIIHNMTDDTVPDDQRLFAIAEVSPEELAELEKDLE